MESHLRLLLLGASGLVGSHLLQQALLDPRIGHVTAPSRRELPAHARLSAPIVDFDDLPQDAHWWHTDAMLCTLGTTLRKAGSREAFRRIDHDLPLAAAARAHASGTRVCVLCSALGADPSSRVFYSRVKGELERDLAAIGFESLVVVRPGIIAGDRDEHRPGERWTLRALQAVRPLLPRAWRPSPATRIADAMLEAAIARVPGQRIVSSSALA